REKIVAETLQEGADLMDEARAKIQALDLTEETDVPQLVDAKESAATNLTRGDHRDASASLVELSGQFEDIGRVSWPSGFPEREALGDEFYRTSRDLAKTGRAVSDAFSEPADSVLVKDLTLVLETVEENGPEQLQRMASQLLETDAELGAFGLDGRPIGADLPTIGKLLRSDGFRTERERAQSGPRAYIRALVLEDLVVGIATTGEKLIPLSGAILVPELLFLVDCSDDCRCGRHHQCDECEGIGLGVGQTGDPSPDWDLEGGITDLGQFLTRNPLAVAMNVVKFIAVSFQGMTLWAKVGYWCCESTWCFPWVDADCECVAHESFVRITRAGGGNNWPGYTAWDRGTLNEFEAQAEAAIDDACQNPC
ncbi:MAG: hypothetical protein R3324_16380, partial [Halobacteriales archaeon]|nr:hypothetical protein [Halobacteriales archaeon]